MEPSPPPDKNCNEQRFCCMVCLCPRLRMVYGKCQHKFCVDCLYNNKDNSLRIMSCPLCNQTGQFPEKKPVIPDDNIEIQKCLGIVECPNEGCNYEMWSWDQEQHFNECPNRKSPATKKKTSTYKNSIISRPYFFRKSKKKYCSYFLRLSSKH
ncbi:tripartite motif-containing protein 3-like [Octopus sinensis]|uniref:Tripartite motif-containing protein 3-like n=1 Tax=Octopus sinensis TaxID=2607531 RepID=A0A7E6F7C4_9MOLL|nr:tripartite motif-containing protein 3-like [Octopus sinensis]